MCIHIDTRKSLAKKNNWSLICLTSDLIFQREKEKLLKVAAIGDCFFIFGRKLQLEIKLQERRSHLRKFGFLGCVKRVTELSSFGRKKEIILAS